MTGPNRMSRYPAALLLGASALLLASALSGACQSGEKRQPAEAGENLLALLPITERGGAQLWGDNCARCHNSRPPNDFTDDQWEVIMHHMRVRANLTAYEHEKILKFLQSAN